jgi:hypothetical protein
MQDERNISVTNMEFHLKKNHRLLHYEEVTKRVGWKCVNIFNQIVYAWNHPKSINIQI